MTEAAGSPGPQRRRTVRVGSRALRWAAISLFLVCFLWCSGVLDFFRPYLLWEQLGSVQVLSGPEEAWLFLQIDRRILIPGRLASAPNRAIGHFQEVVVIDESGVKSQTRVARENGVSFHPNISTLFYLDGALYLYEDWSMGTHRSVFRWDDDEFVLLPLEESEAMLRKLGVTEEDASATNLLLQNSEWKRISESRPFDQDRSFTWRGLSFRVVEKSKADGHTELWLECKGPRRTWSALLTTYDGRKREVARVPRMEDQGAHPR